MTAAKNSSLTYGSLTLLRCFLLGLGSRWGDHLAEARMDKDDNIYLRPADVGEDHYSRTSRRIWECTKLGNYI
jgi:hypothetical protein